MSKMKCKSCGKDFNTDKSSEIQKKLSLGPGCYDKFLQNEPRRLEYSIRPDMIDYSSDAKWKILDSYFEDFSKLVKSKKEGEDITEEAYKYAISELNVVVAAASSSLLNINAKFQSDVYGEKSFKTSILDHLENKDNPLSLLQKEDIELAQKELKNTQYLPLFNSYVTETFRNVLSQGTVGVDSFDKELMPRDYALEIYDRTYGYADPFMKMQLENPRDFLTAGFAAALAAEIDDTKVAIEKGISSHFAKDNNSFIYKELVEGNLQNVELLDHEVVRSLHNARDFVAVRASDNTLQLTEEAFQKMVESKDMSKESSSLLSKHIISFGKGKRRKLHYPYFIAKENTKEKVIDQSPQDLLPAMKTLKLAVVDKNYSVHSGSLATAFSLPFINKMKKEDGVDAVVVMAKDGVPLFIEAIKSNGKMDKIADYNPAKAILAAKLMLEKTNGHSYKDYKPSDILATNLKGYEYYVTLPNGNNLGTANNSETYRVAAVPSYNTGIDDVEVKNVWDVTRTFCHDEPSADGNTTYYNFSGHSGLRNKPAYYPLVGKQDAALINPKDYNLGSNGLYTSSSPLYAGQKGSIDYLRGSCGAHSDISRIVRDISVKKGADKDLVDALCDDLEDSSKTFKVYREGIDFGNLKSGTYKYDKYKNQELLSPKRALTNDLMAMRDGDDEDV